MTTIDLPALTVEADDWMRHGACKGLTHLFFPPAAERPQARERREAAAAGDAERLRDTTNQLGHDGISGRARCRCGWGGFAARRVGWVG